jgi:hypothetical protein
MNKKLKNIFKWIIIIIVVIAAGIGYGFSKSKTGWSWDLETAVVFSLGLMYLVGLGKILMWLFRK